MAKMRGGSQRLTSIGLWAILAAAIGVGGGAFASDTPVLGIWIALGGGLGFIVGMASTLSGSSAWE